jgi:hypothetical protein
MHPVDDVTGKIKVDEKEAETAALGQSYQG